MNTETLRAFTDAQRAIAIRRAVAELERGEVVALPTETVYGLGADALNADACLKIFAAKERPRFDPLIVHLPGHEFVDRITSIQSSSRDTIQALTRRFWPGPLTLVLPRAAIVPDVVTSGLETVAVRVSAHPVFAAVVSAFAKPIAAPSANRFGRISPTTAAHVHEELGGRIPLIIDAGPATHGIESTIVALREGKLFILRRGPVTEEQLAEFGSIVDQTKASGTVEAPGQLASHYAPRTPLKLVDSADDWEAPAGKRCGLLAWRSAGEEFALVRHLSRSGDLREAASNLFGMLRELDNADLDLIVAEAVPDHDLGSAIMDRLRRASAAREAD